MKAIRRFLKKPLKSPIVINLIARMIGFLADLLNMSIRWERINAPIIEGLINSEKGFIGTLWHNRLAMIAYAWETDRPLNAMISFHSDGQLLSKVLALKKIYTVAGSTSRGGSNAMRESVKILKNNEIIGLTPDGPRGPRYSINPGLIHIARMAKVDIMPCTYSTKNRIVFNSWDRLILPLPFTKGVFIYGEPLRYEDFKNKEDTEKAVEILKERMIDITSQADRLCGHEPFEPGEARR